MLSGAQSWSLRHRHNTGTWGLGTQGHPEWYQFNLTNLASLAGRTIQAGDTLRWVQWSNGGSKGGLIITYTDGTDSCCSSAPAINDQNGEAIARGNLSTNQWEYRSASLSPVAGKAISQIRLYADGQTTPGQWDIYFQDLVFTAAAGEFPQVRLQGRH